MGIAVYCVNVTKKSVEKRVSILTNRGLSIAKNKIKNSNPLNIYIIEPHENRVKNRLYSSRTKTVEDLKLKQIALNNLNIIKHQIPFKYLVYIINFFCVSRI